MITAPGKLSFRGITQGALPVVYYIMNQSI